MKKVNVQKKKQKFVEKKENNMNQEVIDVGKKIYYIINPDSKMDVPSFFFESIEREYKEWIKSGDHEIINFYDFCLNKLKRK